MKLTHIRLLVNKFGACFRFYRDVLGFTPTFGKEDEDYADFNTGDVTLALFPRKIMSETLATANKPDNIDTQDRAALIFAVENVDETCRRLKSRGVQFVAEPIDHADWGIRTAHFRDPDGNLIEINQSLA